MLIVRIAELGKIAWRDGRDEARIIERRCVRVLDAVGGRILRANDLIAHDAGSGDICILIRARRDSLRTPMPGDARTVLQRIVTALQHDMPLAIEHGWINVHEADITDMHVLCEAALQRGKIEAERFAFFSAVGHELRTPLTAIHGSLEIVCDHDSSRETVTRFADIALSETKRLTRLVDALFTLSLDDEELDISSSSSLAQAISAAIATQAAALRAADIKITVTIDDAVPAIAMPEDRLVQVLVILLDNALKHGRASHIRFVGHVPAADLMTLLIEDDGIGIAEADRSRIFFFGERGSSHSAGTGIGLALVRRFVERFDGAVTCIESMLGGAAFALQLRTNADIVPETPANP